MGVIEWLFLQHVQDCYNLEHIQVEAGRIVTSFSCMLVTEARISKHNWQFRVDIRKSRKQNMFYSLYNETTLQITSVIPILHL